MAGTDQAIYFHGGTEKHWRRRGPVGRSELTRLFGYIVNFGNRGAVLIVNNNVRGFVKGN